jgi:predicted lipoprotein with Yx(FWY)xxD motif
MRRTTILLAAAGITAIVATAPIAFATTAAKTPTLNLTSTSLGMILTSKGDTMFSFTKDKRGKEKCQSISGCTGTWKPLYTKGTPKAGSGVNASLIGTIKLKNGKKQVTYHKHPLYIYSFAPTGTSYVDVVQFGGGWDALNSAGKPVN